MENKNIEKLSDNAEVYRAVSASSPGHYREGISSDRKFLKDICHWWTLVLQVHRVNQLDA